MGSHERPIFPDDPDHDLDQCPADAENGSIDTPELHLFRCPHDGHVGNSIRVLERAIIRRFLIESILRLERVPVYVPYQESGVNLHLPVPYHNINDSRPTINHLLKVCPQKVSENQLTL